MTCIPILMILIFLHSRCACNNIKIILFSTKCQSGQASSTTGSPHAHLFQFLPWQRLKRFPLLAATCILAVRGLIINVGFCHRPQLWVLHLVSVAVKWDHLRTKFERGDRGLYVNLCNLQLSVTPFF
jgi:hypothetical protein